MASKTAVLAVRVISDTTQANKGLDSVGKSADKTGLSLQKLTPIAVGVVAALGAMAVKFVGAASDLQQAAGGVDAVFGQYADSMHEYAKGAADAVGLSAAAYQNLAVIIGSQLKNAGQPMSEIAGKTQDLIKLGSDLAATYGGDVNDAVSAISALMRGETDPIERYGVSIKQVDINARIMAMGLDTSTSAAKKQAQSVAALSLLYDQTSAAQGQFARESDTMAGSQQRANAQWENAQAALGEALLPAFTALAGMASKLSGILEQNAGLVSTFAIIIGVLAVAILAANAAQWLWNFAMAANPIGLVVIAIALLIAIIYVLIANWEKVEQVFTDVWSTIIDWFNTYIVNGFKNGLDQIAGFFQSVTDFIVDCWNWVIESIKSVIDWLYDLFTLGIPDWFNSVFGVSATYQAAGVPNSAPTAFGRAATMSATADIPTRAASSRRSAAPVVINVNGALDPNGVARQIAGILTHYGRAQGTMSAGSRFTP